MTNRATVRIMIFPAEIAISEIDGYDESMYGKSFSNLNEICVNQVTNGYTILYNDNIFSRLNVSIFGDHLVQLFTKNLPNTTVELEIYYFYMGSYFYDQCGIAILQLDDYLSEWDYDNIEYNTSESVTFLLSHYDDEDEEFYINEGTEIESDNDVQDDDEYEDPFDFGTLSYKKRKKNMKKKSYGYSRVLKASKGVKKNVKRHGIIVSSDRDARKRDEKILQSFLKDFIPGKSSWIKEYRAAILERWMDMYVISKKVAKRMSKEHKASSNKRRRPIVTRDGAVDFTKRLFQGYDPFLDPNR